MFSQIIIEKFRGFEGIRLDNLSEINLITGKNGAGKTSVLEAIFLLAGANNAALVISIANFRNDVPFSAEVDRPFRSLFYQLNPDNNPVLTALGGFVERQRNARRSLQIRPMFRTEVHGILSSSKQVITGIRFRFRGPSGATEGRMRWNEAVYTQPGQFPDATQPSRDLFSIETTPVRDSVEARFVTPYYRNLIGQISEWLSDAIKNKTLDAIVDACRIVEPELKALIPLTESNRPGVYADIGLDQLIPISLLGAGFFNVLLLSLTMNELRNGIVLIDEIEDGLHYSVRPNLVQLIFEYAKNNNIQFFVTTHSDETIRAFGAAANVYHRTLVSAHRLARIGGKATMTQFPPDEFEAAIELDAEIR
jgi:hypothetical protein